MRDFHVTITCDRCLQTVEGRQIGSYTTGFYKMADPLFASAGRPGEQRICSACMMSDPRHQVDYEYPEDLPY
jgi:hypothetical protein